MNADVGELRQNQLADTFRSAIRRKTADSFVDEKAQFKVDTLTSS